MTLKKGFHGIVESKIVKGSSVYVKFSNQSRRQSIKNGFNYAYDIPHLIDFITTGDEIYKNECSDTVYIQRTSENYHFIQLAYWYNNSSKSEEYKKKYMADRLMHLHKIGCDVDSISLEFGKFLLQYQVN